MKTKLVILILLTIVITSCIRSIASDDDFMDTRVFHNRPVGESAADLLRQEDYTSLTIEIDYMQGFEPDTAALENLKLFLYEHLHKPDGIRVVTREIKPASDSVLTLDAVAAIENANRNRFVKGKDLAIYVLYTNGYFSNHKMLGWAYRNTSVVIFGRKLFENSGVKGAPDRTKLETTILQHEMGHLMGLVNVGSPLLSDHKDNKNGKHCSNTKCLMYHVVETKKEVSILMKKEVPVLDKECLADLRANGGR